MDDFFTTISLFRHAIAGIILVSFICSYLGVYIVLKRIIFVGVAVAQISSFGVAFALLLGLPPMIFSMLFTLLGMLGMSRNPGGKRLSQEAIIGIGFITASAVTILLMAKSALGIHEIENIVYGNVLAVTPTQVYIALGVVVTIITVHLLFYKEIVFVSFDYDMARALGIKAAFWNLILYLSIGAGIAIGIMIAGNLMIVAAIILPPINGLILCKRLSNVFIVSCVQGVSTATLAFFISYLVDLPYGPTAAASSSVVLGLSFIAFKLRG
ncbi:MAG: metal ABC transporter permease [Candidatus Brocadiales bacterium]